MKFLLVIDVGNTNVKFGLYENSELAYFWRISTIRNQTVDDLKDGIVKIFEEYQLKFDSVKGVMISSVVPSLTPVLEEVISDLFHCKALIVGPGIKTGLHIQYENPKELGADRVASAVAALHLYGAPIIVVGLGTATTFCVIDDAGAYLGGLILPGIQISTEALFQHASQLPRIQLAIPRQVLGRDTVENMQSGAIHGGAAQVDGIIQRIRKQMPLNFKVVATGGLSEIIAPHTLTVQFTNPRLLFEGLRILWNVNQVS